MTNSQTILALETAINGGSISLFHDGEEIAFECGKDNISRSEELLANIKHLLESTSTNPEDLSKIAVSRGPGSFTGIRIGISTALGLARSLNIQCVGVPLIEAIAASFQKDYPFTLILPIGKTDVVCKTFSNSGENNSESVISVEDVWLKIPVEKQILVHESLLLRLTDQQPNGIKIDSIGNNLAMFTARSAHLWTNKIDLTPIYLQNPAKRSNLY